MREGTEAQSLGLTLSKWSEGLPTGLLPCWLETSGASQDIRTALQAEDREIRKEGAGHSQTGRWQVG